jgi:alpha-D-ribose 1-methylphosphonate 5-phosphate C-P lyase
MIAQSKQNGQKGTAKQNAISKPNVRLRRPDERLRRNLLLMYQVPQSVPAMIVRPKTAEEPDPSVAARVVLEPSIDNTGSPYDWKDTSAFKR